ncbi:hypothetical protein [uncultured Bilophila sp.]|uniref:hypothetical protein n=1 Tax=uncultured Bilophila sp. TaxID=529385 RepID=UPI00266F483F|nr:hypothetical protein [uncultured Bilophila sp.]
MTTSIPLHGEALSIIAQITVFVKVARRIFTPVSTDFHARLGGFYGSARRIFMDFYGFLWLGLDMGDVVFSGVGFSIGACANDQAQVWTQGKSVLPNIGQRYGCRRTRRRPDA